jgi:Zn-dependent membrane protease YugP
MNAYWILMIVIMVLSYGVQWLLKSRFEKYSAEAIQMSGKEVAEKMLRDNGITDVKVSHVQGTLTDHYNPLNKTLNLSDAVYNERNIAAAAVAAHECGHAVQHATGYAFLKMRSALVPVVSFASNWVQWVLLAGILLINIFPSLLLIGIILFALTTLFSIVTLPVEVNASSRALDWLSQAGITNAQSYPMARKALSSAAYTYFVAAISSLGTLLYYVMIYMGRRE